MRNASSSSARLVRLGYTSSRLGQTDDDGIRSRCFTGGFSVQLGGVVVMKQRSLELVGGAGLVKLDDVGRVL